MGLRAEGPKHGIIRYFPAGPPAWVNSLGDFEVVNLLGGVNNIVNGVIEFYLSINIHFMFQVTDYPSQKMDSSPRPDW